MLRVLVGTLSAARHSVEVGHIVAHKDVPALLVLVIDLASGNPEDIRMAAAGYIGKLAPVGHNLAGVDVPQEAGLGMVGIPSMAAEVPDTANSYSKQEHPVPGHVVEVVHSQVTHGVYEVDVCLVPVSSEKLCS